MINFIKCFFRIIKLVIFIILIGMLITICANNAQNVSISLDPFPYQMESKLFLIILIFFFSGLILGMIFGSIGFLGRKKDKKRKADDDKKELKD